MIDPQKARASSTLPMPPNTIQNLFGYPARRDVAGFGLFLLEGWGFHLTFFQDAEALAGGFDFYGVGGIGFGGGLSCQRAAGMKRAACGRLAGAGNFAFEDNSRGLGPRVGLGDGAEERHR